MSWLLLFAAAAALVFVLRKLDQKHPKTDESLTDELHHGYYGALAALGLLLGQVLPPEWADRAFWVCMALLLEDLGQHAIQLLFNYRFRGPIWHLNRLALRALHSLR